MPKYILDFETGERTSVNPDEDIVINTEEGQTPTEEVGEKEDEVEEEESSIEEIDSGDQEEGEEIEGEIEEEESPTEEEEVDEDELNPYKDFGETIKGTGWLPNDFEIPDDVDGEQLLNKVGEYVIPKYKQQAIQEVQKALVDQGITQEDLYFAKARRTGASPEILTNLATYEQLQFTKTEELADEEKTKLIKFMYSDQKVDPLIVEAALEKHADDLDPLVNKVVEYAKTKYSSLKKLEDDRQEAVDKARLEKEQYNTQVLKSVFTNRKLGNYDLDDEDLRLINDSIYKANQPLNVNGQNRMVSAYDKFLHLVTHDINFQLQAFYQIINSDKITKKLSEEVEDKVEKNFLKRRPIKKVSLKRKKTKSTPPKVKKQEEEISTRY